jgi:hypothetical protein
MVISVSGLTGIAMMTESERGGSLAVEVVEVARCVGNKEQKQLKREKLRSKAEQIQDLKEELTCS